ncbi:MAG: hypothetical protein HC874_27750 [Richelia sp. SL_2_1]|nr:hypothetical protein [Richelia sp. SM1_7_0]NJN09184.1 hypothetical protein [Richelia sp. RM1_1_1]NJO30924.1 hypothetical protein [Richelia sp. SL_2_1]
MDLHLDLPTASISGATRKTRVYPVLGQNIFSKTIGCRSVSPLMGNSG